MKRIRFSIGSLLLVVLFIALAVAALRAADDAWDRGVFGLTLLTLLTAVLLTVHRTERRRAYWLGFALFGASYLALSLVPPLESRLPTTKGLAYLDSKVPGRPRVFTVRVAFTNTAGQNPGQTVAFSPQGGALTASSKTGSVQFWNSSTGTILAGSNGNTENFIRIGHSLVALVLAYLGGHLSRFLHAGNPGRRNDEEGEQPATPGMV